MALNKFVGTIINTSSRIMGVTGLGKLLGQTINPAAVAYLLTEDFEGTGIPSGWTATGTVNWADSSAPIAGSKSFSETWGGGLGLYALGASQTTICSFFAYKPSATGTIYVFTNNSTTTLRLTHGSDGSGIFQDTEGGFSYTSAGTVPLNAVTYLWFERTASGTCIVYASSTTTKPASPACTIAAGSSPVTHVVIGNDGIPAKFDYLRVATAPIGSNPS